ncbi:Ig-like domain repeat protein [Microbacterium hominis]|uniref:Ig-like domain-containing protein n=1 Tax=Microbacterium hominis TaxID=162426 RepID=UPI0019624E8A|nr:Ig-like domain-containing protein [Microbacterium hominis]QRY42027.1 Ig-like domain repeat protein [Microbacterium hominis]
MFVPGLRDTARAVARSWWQLVVVQLLFALALTVLVGAVALAVGAVVSDVVTWAMSDPAAVDERIVGMSTAVAAVLLGLLLPLNAVVVAASVDIADAALAGATPRVGGSVVFGLRQTGRSLAAALTAVAVTVAALVFAPVLSVVGVVGLLVRAVARVVRRARSREARSSGARPWVVLAVPFGALWRVGATAILLVPAALIERAWPLRAWRAADAGARGRRWSISACWVIVVLACAAIVALAAWVGDLGRLGWGAPLSALVQLIAVPVPVVVAVALYRRAIGTRLGPRTAPGHARVRPRPAESLVVPGGGRVATALVVALLLPLGVAAVPGAASAAAPDAGALQISVVSAADTSEESALAAQLADCKNGGAQCTLRAALALAETYAAGGGSSVTIDISGAPTIALGAPLSFAPDHLVPTTPGGGGEAPPATETPASTETATGEEMPPPTPQTSAIGPGTLAIVGHGAVLDGGRGVRILSVVSEYWNLSVSGLTLRNGRSSDFGGALMAGVPRTTVQAVTFVGNTATSGGGAVFARTLDVSASSFIDSTASGRSSTTLGGAIRATGTITVTNSTFAGSAIGDQFTRGRNQGTDIYADADMNVVNSTFVDSQGGSLASPNAVSAVRNSLFVTDRSEAAFLCAGRFDGGHNLSASSDTTCPGTSGQSVPGSPLAARDDSGVVPVFPPVPNGPARGAGADCPAVDALGAVRPAQGCDLGAVQVSAATAVSLDIAPDTEVYGRATMTATVSAVSGAVPSGSVTFTIGDRTFGPITLADTTPATDGDATASVVVSDLTAGQTYGYSAAFHADPPLADSAAGPFTYTVAQHAVAVGLACAASAGDACAGAEWTLGESAPLSLHVTVDDDRSGSVVLAADPGGTTIVVGPRAVRGGVADFSVAASDLGWGRHRLYALYTSDDRQHVGTAATQPTLLVRRDASVTMSVSASQAVYGDGAARAQVAVTGAGPTPTGTVAVGGERVTLDAEGRATVDLSLGFWGVDGVTAVYQGDDDYAAASSARTPFTVVAAATSTVITGVAPQHPVAGQALTVVAEIRALAPSTATPWGAYTLTSDGAPVPGVTATPGEAAGVRTVTFAVPAAALTVGDHELRVTFTADPRFADSPSPATRVEIAAASTSTRLTVSDAVVGWADDVTLTAHVDSGAAQTADGVVVFSAGARTLGSASLAPCADAGGSDCAVATLTVTASSIGIGPAALGARYVGTDVFAGSAADAVAVTVDRARPTVTLDAPAAIGYGATPTITVKVAAGTVMPPTGAVAITATTADGRVQSLGSAALSQGAGTIILPAGSILPGTYALSAAFGGDEHFVAAAATTALTVTTVPTRVALDSSVPQRVAFNGSLDVGVTVASLDGALPPEGDVVLTWQGIEVGRATLTAADDVASQGRHVVIPAHFGPSIPFLSDGRLTARFVGATGFADADIEPGPGGDDPRMPVTITPLAAAVAVTTRAVIGSPLEAVATVTIAGAPDGIAPEGQITFTVTAGDRTYGSVTAALVNGTVSLSDTRLRDILVDTVGHWSVSVLYLKTGGDNRYAAELPGTFAVDAVQVGWSQAAVAVVAPAQVEAGVPLTVEVRVAGAVTAGGTVWVQGVGAAAGARGEAVPLVDGRATARLEIPAMLPLGSAYSFTVEYSGDSALASAASDPFPVALVARASTVQLVSATAAAGSYPGIVGGRVAYIAHTTTSTGPVPGLVTLLRDGERIAGAAVNENGDVRFDLEASSPWTGTLVAVFAPADPRVAPGEARLPHRWVSAPVRVTVTTVARPSAGAPVMAAVAVAFDPTRYPLALADALPTGAPRGTVEITDGQGAGCVASLEIDAGAPMRSVATCEVSYRTVGPRALTATSSGDGVYEAGVGTASVSVERGTPVVQLLTPSANWSGLATIPVAWSVDRADGGTVTLLRGRQIVCTSTALRGSCDVTMPAIGLLPDDGDLTVRYSGTDLWYPGSATVSGSITACIPAASAAASPAGSADVAITTAPNCGGGTGYWQGVPVSVTADPRPGRWVTRVAAGALDAVEAQYDSGGRPVSARITPTALVRDGALLPFSVTAYTQARCIPVAISSGGIADARTALNILQWSAPDACGGQVRVDGATAIVSLPVGGTFTVGINRALIPARTQFAGWTDTTGDARLAETATFAVTPDTTRIVASFSPICYPMPTIVQPVGGRITVDAPLPNCTDPATGARAWTFGTSVSGELRDDGPGVRTYFEGWSGDISRYTGRDRMLVGDGQGGYHYARPFTFTVGDSSFRVAASYGSCVSLTLAVRGDAGAGKPGSIQADTPANCPVSPGAAGDGWYKKGTAITLSATPGAGGLRFLGWDGLGLTGRPAFGASASIMLVTDTTATASFGTNANCRPLAISAVPADGLRLETSWALGENACQTMYGPTFYDQGIDGNAITVDAAPINVITQGAEIVFAFATSPPGSPSGQSPTIANSFVRTSTLNEEVYGNTEIVAYACDFVAISATVRAPGATAPVPDAGASNIDRASKDRLSGFVATPEADCATGADPRSGYGGYAWRAGTALLPIVTADPAAYRFLGWSGDAAGVGETPDTPVLLTGPGRRVDGDAYHRRITAQFEAICHRLSVPSDTALIEVLTEPNCPGVDPSQKLYLGGTSVVLHATDGGDTLFRHWSRGTSAIDPDDGRWASVDMTQDATVVAYYSSKSVGEQFQTYGGQVADVMAVSAKKMLGVAAAAMTSYVKTLVTKVTLVTDGIGYLAQGLEKLGVKGTVIDGMKSASSMLNSVISLLWAPLDCLTAWSAGGEDTVLYAAQNLIGSLAVGRLSQAAQAASSTSAAANSLSQMIADAQKVKAAVKPVALTGLAALKAAKAGYDAAQAGDIGLDSSAYEAWGSQQSLSVYSTCMASRTGAAAETMDRSARAVTGG